MQVWMLRKYFNNHPMERLSFLSTKAKTTSLSRKNKKMRSFIYKKVRNKLKYKKMIAVKNKRNQINF